MARKESSHAATSKSTYEDETLYCENCGISFIWTAEEQRPQFLVNTAGADTPDWDTLVDDDLPELGLPELGRQAIDSGSTTVVMRTEPLRKPSCCPGCNQLLPVLDRERGLLKWYHRRKGYGFIIRRAAPDLYVQRAAFQRAALQGSGPVPGDLVEFAIGDNRQGLSAVRVTIVEKAM